MATIESARIAYLGYPLEITERHVTILDRQGRRLATVASISTARRFIKGYRRIPNNTEVAAQPREERATTSERGEPTCV